MKQKSSNYTIRNTEKADTSSIISLCRQVYPKDIAYDTDTIHSQISTFSQGQFVAVNIQGKVIGASSSMLICAADYDLFAGWDQVTTNGSIANHNQKHSDTLYGVDTMVHPLFQGIGVGKSLHLRRVNLAKKIKLQRIRGGARLVGYSAFSKLITPSEYLNLVVSKRINDRALSFLVNFGYVIRGLAKHYLKYDPESYGWAAIVDYDLSQK